MDGVEFQRATEKFREAWPRALPQVRAEMLWNTWRHLPYGVFEESINALIYRGGNAPSGEDIDAMITHKHKAHNLDNADKLPVLEGCEICRHTGMLEYSGNGGNYVAACTCKLGESYRGKLHSSWDMEKAGYTRRQKVSSEISKHPEFMLPDEKKYGAQLCGLFRCVQRAILMKKKDEKYGVAPALESLGVTKAEAYEIYQDMRRGHVSDRIKHLRNRSALKSLLPVVAQDAPEVSHG